jgi:AraC family transcriptional regulator of adaptative response / DNA-3-methyladenine glycosylase II
LQSGDLALGPGSDRVESLNALSKIPGIGPWTRQVIAMRALGDPDAFPESDLGVRHAAERLGFPSTPAALVERSQAWRPWRAYAVQYLWSVDDHRINDWPPRA